MKTATINVKVENAFKRQAQNFAKSAGMSLSDIVNLSLRQVINQGRLVIEPEPNEYLKTAIADARKQRQKGSYKSFQRAEDAVSFIKNLK